MTQDVIGQTLNLSIAGLDVAQAGIKSVISDLDGIQKDMVTASQAGIDLAAVQQDITARQTSIQTLWAAPASMA